MVGTVLTAQHKSCNLLVGDVRLIQAKSDFDRYLDILILARGTAGYEALQRRRVIDLQRLRDMITVV